MNVLMATIMVPNAAAASAGAIVMYDEVQAIAERHHVTLATLATDDDHAALQMLRDMGLNVHAVFRHRTTGVMGLLRRAEVGMRWRLGNEPLRTAVFREREIQRVLDHLGTTPFDVVHVLDNAMAGYRLPAARATIVSEYEVRTGIDDVSTSASSLSSVNAREAERRRWWSYQSAAWSRFDRVQVFTDDDATSVRQIAPHVADRVRVNPFGVHLAEAVPPTASATESLVFVGGFQHPPNVDAAMWLVDEILPLVRARRPGVTLTIVGADPPSALRARARAGVRVTGRVDRVEPFLYEASVVVAPLRAGGGMRLKVLQAMALGRPVVATSRGAAGIWNPRAAPTIRVADDAPGIAGHVTALLDSEADRAALGARARQAVEAHHRRDQFAERLRAIYEELQHSGAAA